MAKGMRRFGFLFLISFAAIRFRSIDSLASCLFCEHGVSVLFFFLFYKIECLNRPVVAKSVFEF